MNKQLVHISKQEKNSRLYKDKISVYNFREYLYSLRHYYDSKNNSASNLYIG